MRSSESRLSGNYGLLSAKEMRNIGKKITTKAIIEFRSHWHWVGGYVAGFCSLFSVGIPIATTIAFCAYEFKQDIDLGTKSHKDILEWIVALFAGFLSIIPLKILGVG